MYAVVLNLYLSASLSLLSSTHLDLAQELFADERNMQLLLRGGDKFDATGETDGS